MILSKTFVPWSLPLAAGMAVGVAAAARQTGWLLLLGAAAGSLLLAFSSRDRRGLALVALMGQVERIAGGIGVPAGRIARRPGTPHKTAHHPAPC